MEMTLAPKARRWRSWLAPMALAASTLLLAACGGGGSATGGGGNAAPQTFSSGRISGFGSVIVNGVRFDDSAATVVDDDGVRHDRGELKLGMVVDVRGGEVERGAAGASASASDIVMRSEIKGPVEAVDGAAGRLTVLGQTVIVDATTVFEDMPTGLDALAAGDLVEVYAFFDRTTGEFTAARIEKKAALERYKLRGLVASLDTTAKTFRIGGALIDYSGATEVPAGLADNMLVKVKLATTQQAGAWMATKVEAGDRRMDDVADADEAELSGLVSDFTGLASFKVGGIPVDASGANVTFLRGTSDGVANGVHLEVEGTVSNGVLIATKVKFEDGEDGAGGNGGEREVELHGAIDALDTAAQTFVLRGVTVHYGDATEFRDGLSAETLAGKQVEVKGQLASNGTMVEAERIKLDD